MKYTIESFMRSLFDKDDLYEINKRFAGDNFFIKWDGERIIVYVDLSPIESIAFFKVKSGYFQIGLEAVQMWNMDVKFSDGGIIKNKVYNVKDYVL